MFKLLSDIIAPRDEREDLKTLKSMLMKYQNDQLVVNDEVLKIAVEAIRYHANSSQVCVIACHFISNLALDEDTAVQLIEMKIVRYLVKILKLHSYDYKVVWKCSSALWNLCRPNDITSNIPDETVRHVFKCLVKNSDHIKSTHTCLGALSNLALVLPEAFSACISQGNRLEVLSRIVWKYRKETSITGHFGAMVANMSVITNLAHACVNAGFVRMLIEFLGQMDNREAVKHTIAALHNLSDADNFAYHMCDCMGVEILRDIQSQYEGDIANFVSGIFELSRMPETATTTLQAAVACCDLVVVIDLLRRGLAAEDSQAVEFALQRESGDMVTLLLASGATFDQKSWEDETTSENFEAMALHIDLGKRRRFQYCQNLQTLMIESSSKLHRDMAQIVTDCVPGIDVLISMYDSNASWEC